MKKMVRIFAMVLTLALLLGVAPMALAAAAPKGKFEVVDKSGITICELDELGIATLTYENANIVAGGKYLMMVVKLNPGFQSNEDYIISGDNGDVKGTLIDIDQIDSAPENGKITFVDVYPRELTDCVILITGDGLDPTDPVVARIKLNYTLGDVNNDGKINTRDAMLVARKYAKLPINDTFIEEAADVNSDGRINTRDAMLIARYYAKLITEFPVE